MAARDVTNWVTSRRARYQRISARSTHRWQRGRDASSQVKSVARCSAGRHRWGGSAFLRCMRIGPIALRVGNCRQFRRVHKVWKETSLSLSGTGPDRRTISMMKFQSTEGIRIPTPTVSWGTEPISVAKATAHSLMMDSKGRVWTAAATRPRDNPDFCKQGSSHPSAIAFPITQSSRQTNFYDPKTKQWTLVDMCASSQHLMFAEDADNTLWFSNPGGDNVGWLNTKMFDETHDEQKSQGWTPFILDTNGNGKRDAYTEPGQPSDPTKDTRIKVGFYAVGPNPADGSVWGTTLGFPGALVRLNPGSDPTKTALAEIYEVPWNNPKATVQGFSPRGMDIDRNGVIWTVLASGHYASFDRRKCKGPLNGPTATGQHCPEGWTLYRTPGPSFQGQTEYGSSDTNYYNWVDQFDTFGMGKDTPIATAN